MVMMTSEDSAVSQVSFFGVWPVRSMPTSRMTSTAAGLTRPTGSLPAERTSTASPARWRSHPAAIWDRPALCTQTNRTLGLPLTVRLLRYARAGSGNADGVGGVGDHDLVGGPTHARIQRQQ